MRKVLDASRASMEDAKREHRADIKKLSEEVKVKVQAAPTEQAGS